MSALKIKNSLGEWQEVPMIKGDKGETGESGTSPAIVRFRREVILIPCDENGLCRQTLITSFRFTALKGEEQVGAYAFNGTSEQEPYHINGLDIWLVQPCTANEEGIINVKYTAGTDPFVGINYDTYQLNPRFFFDTGEEVRKTLQFIKVRKGADGEDYILTVQDKEEIAGLVEVPDVPVEDVQINGASILVDGVANIPRGNGTVHGVVKTSASYGTQVVSNSYLLAVARASDSDVQNSSAGYKPIVPLNQHAATFYGLAKAAGINPNTLVNGVGVYTDEAKGAIQSMLGVDSLIAPTETNPFTDAHSANELFIINGKLYRAKTAIAVGDVLDVGTNAEVVNVGDVVVKDVQVNGTSVTSDGVANIPSATGSVAGVVKVNQNGLWIYDGIIRTNPASDAQIKAGTNANNIIGPATQHISTFYGLANAAGDTTQKTSSNAVGTYTDEAKAAIRSMLGIETLADIIEAVHDSYAAAEEVSF